MRRLLPIAFGIAVSTVALGILISTFDVGAVLSVLAEADVRWLVVALGLIAIQLVVRTVRWRSLLPAGPQGLPIPVMRLLPVVLIGYLCNAVLPARLGEPIRAVLVDRREKVGLPEALGSVLLERIVDLAVLAGLILVAALLVDAPPWIIQVAAAVSLVGGVLLGMLATTGVASLVALGTRHPAMIRRRILARAMRALERLAHAIGGRSRRRAIAFASLLSAAAWLLEGGTFWLVAKSLDIELAPSSAMLVAGITVLSTAIPSAPGYLGTYDLAASFAATALGVPEAEALALALLVHAVTLVPLALGGVVSLLALDVRLDSLAQESTEISALASGTSVPESSSPPDLS